MEFYYYILITIGLMFGLSALLYYIVKIGFTETVIFAFFGELYLLSSVWESAIWYPTAPQHFPLWYHGLTLWWVFFGTIGLAFLSLYMIKIYTGHRRVLKTVAMMTMLYGTYWVFGTLEDFGCYVIWGLETFSQSGWAGSIHKDWLYGLPAIYYLAIIGLIYLPIAFTMFRKLNKPLK